MNAWWPLVFYPANDAPKFTKGMWAMIGTCIVTLMVTYLVWYLEQREKRQRLRDETTNQNGKYVGDGEKSPVEDVEDEKRVSGADSVPDLSK